jgi:transposase-like protein
VSVLARRHDVNTNQVFTWRRELLPKKSAALGDGPMVLVTVEPVREERVERMGRARTNSRSVALLVEQRA